MFYSEGDRYYKITRKPMIGGGSQIIGKVSRISCEEYNKNPPKTQPKIGDRVTIIIKPYTNWNCVEGVIKKILTKKKHHTRGHKVVIQNGLIGRVTKLHS